MTGQAPSPAHHDEAAADWFALKRSGGMTAQQLLEFQCWLDAAPENRAAFEDAERSWALAGMLREDPELMLLRAQVRKAYPPLPRRMAAAAAVVAVATVLVGVWLTWREPPGAQQQAFRTGVGQRTTVTLADGSVVMLDTDTVLRTRESGGERRMYLDRGRALFRVAKDPSRPFVVEADGRTITALGTVFDVSVGDAFEVTLVEGKVRVEQSRTLLRTAHSADLNAGYRIEAKDTRDWTVAAADVGKETGWAEGRLTFVDDPLAKVAAELNRYSDRKIVLKDEAVGLAPVVAVFKPGDMESFVKMVRSYELAEVTETENSIELSALR